MNSIELKLGVGGQGAFVIDEGNDRLAEMAVALSGTLMTVYHTEVSEKLRGQGIANKLLDTMVSYARKNNLKVVALCPYVHAQFQRHREKYQDIWHQDGHELKQE